MQDHRTPLADGWSLWRAIWLRSAGFPASMLLELGAPDLARSIDRLLDAQHECESARRTACEALGAEIDASSGDRRKALGKVMHKLKRNEVPASPPERAVRDGATSGEVLGSGVIDAPRLGLEHGPTFTAALADFRERTDAMKTLESDLARTYSAESSRTSEAIRAFAQDPLFREAVLWQNRHAIHTGLNPLLANPGRADSKMRQHERLIASYVQRYCSKNETIGFFGPVGWATVREEEPALSLEHGDALVKKRTVYFEHWAIDAVAEALASDPQLRPHLAPRRMPSIDLDGNTLHYSGGKRATLPDVHARLLAACDGETSAFAIAETLLADSALELSDQDEVYELLDQLLEKKLITWTLEIPTGVAFPETALVQAIERIGDEELHARLQSKLSPLLDARSEVASAAGDATRLDEAIRRLESAFNDATGLAATRNHGQMYAGRTLIYEDCVRDLTCTIGSKVFSAVAEPLSLLLQSARWFTHRIADRFRARALELHAQLGAGELDYLRFWEAIGPEITAESGETPIVKSVVEELRARWASLLLDGTSPEARKIDWSFEQLASRAREIFAAREPGWMLARFHAPDVMIAATSPEAIAAGKYSVILGELHVSVSSLFSQIAISQREDPETFFRAALADLPAKMITPVESKRFATRADYMPLKPGDYQLESGPTRSSFPRERVVAAGSLLVSRDADSLVIHTRDGKLRFELLQFLGPYLTVGAISAFRILPDSLHTPRVSIGKLVIERERWTFDAETLAFRTENDPLVRFRETRRWARAHGLPRFVFVKTKEERKPFYVDFESPIYVDIFALRMKNATKVGVSEMLPGPNELWLRDAKGRAYTSELRTAVLDPLEYSRAI